MPADRWDATRQSAGGDVGTVADKLEEPCHLRSCFAQEVGSSSPASPNLADLPTTGWGIRGNGPAAFVTNPAGNEQASVAAGRYSWLVEQSGVRLRHPGRIAALIYEQVTPMNGWSSIGLYKLLASRGLSPWCR